MKLAYSLILAAAIATPAVSFAQSNQPLTRAQVRANLVTWEKAGFEPATTGWDYPAKAQAAAARISAQNEQAAASN